MMTSLLIDLLILTLLVGAIAYAFVLSRRIARLQSALVELAPALQAFCDAVEQSERSVDEIRRETDRMQTEAARLQRVRTAGPREVKAPEKPGRSDLVRMFFEAAKAKANG